MKGTHPVITLLGNNSGRNLGDAAIMSAIFDSVTKELPDAEFLVPSIAPDFIDKNYSSRFKAKGVDVRPRTLSMRLLGLPTILALKKSDVALICDGIIFGYKLFSPHNFLITLIFVVPLARLVGCKVVCFSCGIGPFPTRLSEIFARWVINLCDLVIMRENDSKQLCEKIGVTKPIQVTGDAAFLNYISSDERAKEILKAEGVDINRPILGLNVTPYLDSWLKASERVSDADSYLNTVAESILEAKNQIKSKNGEDPECVLFSCSPMDEKFTHELASKVNAKVIDNTRFLSHDIQAVMKQCGLLMGMRFHSLVLSSGVGVPIVGLVYAPKVKGYMRYLECPEYAIELNSITPSSLGTTLANAWLDREQLKEKQQNIVRSISAGARKAAKQLVERYFSES
jgi:polysaccharide pyruvyl transferase WcaK-like protein